MTETRQGAMTPSGILHPVLDDVVSTTKNWWLLLVAGVAWIVIAVLILRFDYATVATIATLFVLVSWVAAGALIHGVGQIASAFAVRKVGHGVAALDGQHAS